MSYPSLLIAQLLRAAIRTAHMRCQFTCLGPTEAFVSAIVYSEKQKERKQEQCAQIPTHLKQALHGHNAMIYYSYSNGNALKQAAAKWCFLGCSDSTRSIRSSPLKWVYRKRDCLGCF